MIQTYAYRNITISGLPGAGSTTLLNHLKLELGKEAWHGFSGGEFMRAYAEEKGIFKRGSSFHHAATDYEDDFDRKIDYGVREKLRDEEKWIIESWLSGFLAQEINGVLKVLMVCSDMAVRIDRIINRDQFTVEEALKHINERYQKNLDKWAKMYSEEWKNWVVKPGTVAADQAIDFWRPELYDVIIDTFSVNQQEAVDRVINELKQKS